MRQLYRRILLCITVFVIIAIVFTIIVNVKVDNTTRGDIYTNVDSVPCNRVALLLGTNPLNRAGSPNTYFTNRINIAAELYHARKVDFIIASGDNHVKGYDEPTSMRDSLMAHGVPEYRIILDFAGFRTLDSVVRAKEVFGCDSLTIISQADHCARALYIAKANGIDAVAISAPIKAGRKVRARLAVREWLARDKMMLDLWCGKQPHFLGEKIEIPEIPAQKSYSTSPEIILRLTNPEDVCPPLDSIHAEFVNLSDREGIWGEWFELQALTGDRWKEVEWDDRYRNADGSINVVFNAIAYILKPHSSNEHIIRPWFYRKDLAPGRYRLAKTFHISPYSHPIQSDTAYVEFEIGIGH